LRSFQIRGGRLRNDERIRVLFRVPYKLQLIATRTLLESPDSTASNGAESLQGREAPSRLKLLQLPLPEYSYAPGEDLNKIFSSFENTIGKYAIVVRQYAIVVRKVRVFKATAAQ